MTDLAFRMRSEEVLMEARIGEAYRSYKRSVPMIPPNPWHPHRNGA